jgi:hypothetical protein
LQGLIAALVEYRGYKDPVFYREIGEKRVYLDPEETVRGGLIYPEDGNEAMNRLPNTVTGVLDEDDDGDLTSNTYSLPPGTCAEIIEKLNSVGGLRVKALWQGLHRLREDRWCSGLELDAEYESERSKMRISVNEMDEREDWKVLVLPLEELFVLFRAEYGWGPERELVLLNEDGSEVTGRQELAGAHLILRGAGGERHVCGCDSRIKRVGGRIGRRSGLRSRMEPAPKSRNGLNHSWRSRANCELLNGE